MGKLNFKSKLNFNKSKLFLMMIDVFGIGITYSLTIFIIRFLDSSVDYLTMLLFLPVIMAFKLIVFYFFKIYHLVLVNVGLDEVVKLGIVITVTNLIVFAVYMIIPSTIKALSVFFILINLLEFAFIISPRIFTRLINIMSVRNRYVEGNKTLIIGAGSGGKIVLNEIRNNPNLSNNVIGFVDDDDQKIGNFLSGYPIFGPISEIGKLIDRLKIEEIIFAIVNIEPKRFQEIINYFIDKPIKIKRLPSFRDYHENDNTEITEVKVEDLLNRDVIELDCFGIYEFIENKKIMVTGAGGSIGSELVRQIIGFKPESILMVDIYENGVYDLMMEINLEYSKEKKLPTDIIIQIASVYNYNRMKSIVSDYSPDYIFHAAAYKHVPLMEASALEAIRTNILGTYNMCKLADEFKVKKFVLVSSDKAVRPTNVMGATKRYAEMLIQHFNHLSETNYSAVRFGNVLGSNGSVVPLFKKQIAKGGPVTVTDENIIRYFMTIPEAVSLILQSAVFAAGGEIFILDMGDPVKIIDLAEKMIMLSGFKPYTEIPIKITGLRPGEKLFEELLVDGENNIKTSNKLIFIEKLDGTKNIEEETKELLNQYEELNNLEVKELLRKFVDTYTIDIKS
ncbi:MAG: nucleoside-diphosphate sugar epimerase/dehydratase [Candidatus Izemoplasmatales bacterium]|jgi:FlaA1/EpsC-like NDP-sugar epimerase|nr:nucleoside-diphosphate sugar epimerase/dehydratase [Candidatus Izemoplasmatales bacterium]